MTEEKQNRSNEVLIDCDYLVVGAGASSLAFLDTLLTELPETKVILIDKKKIPGGHWVDAYRYVRLHHPSIVYGLASRQLEGNWLKCMLTKFTLPFMYRSNKNEIVDYFGGFVDDKVASGQVDFIPTLSMISTATKVARTEFIAFRVWMDRCPIKSKSIPSWWMEPAGNA